MKLDMTLDIASSLSAGDWVKQSRVKEADDRSKAARLAELQLRRMDEEEEELLQQASAYKASDLRGLRIKHGETDFEIGQHTILTLADSNILDEDDDGNAVGVSEEHDVLENVNLADADRRLERENRVKRNRQPIYSALDDAEFGAGVAPGTRAPLLAQYDKEKKAAPKMLLGEGGMVVVDKEQHAAVTQIGNGFGDVQSLQISSKVASNYMTAKESVAFVKRSAKSLANAKKRKIKKRSGDDDEEDDVGRMSVTNGVATEMDTDAVEEDQQQSNAADRGSRDTVRTKTAVELALEEEAQKKASYRLAVQRAVETSKMNPNFNPEAISIGSKVSTSSTATVSTFDMDAYNEGMRMERQRKTETENALKRKILASSADWEEDDQELVQALAKARRIAIQQRKGEDTQSDDLSSLTVVEDRGAAQVMKALAQHSTGVVPPNKSEETEGEDIDAEGRRTDGTLVFNSTTEFTSRLQARLNEKARLKTEAAFLDLERGTTGTNNVTSSMNRSESGQLHDDSSRMVAEDVEEVGDEDDIYHDGDNNRMAGSEDEDSDEGEGDDDEQMAFLHRQPLVANSMAATLALLKGSGELRASEELAGRAKDKREFDPSANDFNVKLEYRDDHGRKLTQKEAFRQLSYRFHGYGPGQKKKEKRLKAIETQNKASTSRLGILDGNGGMMGSFTKTQEATGRAHITIQGGASNAAVSASNLASIMKKTKK